MNTINDTEHQLSYSNHRVIDEHGDGVGTVTDVIYGRSIDAQNTGDDNGAGADLGAGDVPTWLIVDPGVMRASHYVPVAGSYRTDDDDLVVPWSKDWILSAPKAGKDHVITDDDRVGLEEHYRAVDG